MFGLLSDMDICLDKEAALKQPPCGLASPLILAGQTLILCVPQVRAVIFLENILTQVIERTYTYFIYISNRNAKNLIA
jgi:hypothetical protein